MALRQPTWTEVLGATAAGLTIVLLVEELRIIRRRAPDPEHPIEAQLEVATAGYKAAPNRENAALNLFAAYAVTAGVARLSTHTIRTRGSFGPFRDRWVRGRHIHHFIPGIALAFLSGGAAIVARAQSLDRWLAIPFGIGTALTLDEAALLIELDDVYWSEEGILSVQATLGALSLLGATALALRTLRRGEVVVFEQGAGAA